MFELGVWYGVRNEKDRNQSKPKIKPDHHAPSINKRN